MTSQSSFSPELVRLDASLSRLSSRRALRVSGFTLRQGEHWCLFGGNGAGKTVLAQLLCGRLHSGSAALHFAPDFDPQRDVLFVSFEEQQRLAALDARHDISEYDPSAHDQGTTVQALVSAGLPLTDTDEARLQALLAALDLQELQARGIRYLSSGQMRKALLARALFRRPRLLVLDEPLESIDHATRETLQRVLTQHLGPDTTTLLLCRRAHDILPGITHLALLDSLTLVSSGALASVRASAEFMQLAQRRLPAPAQLPLNTLRRPFSPMLPDEPLLALHKVNAGYPGKPVLRALDWTFRRGQHALISGPNGCGKSTLLSLLCGDNHMAYGQDVVLFGRRRGSGESVWEVKARFGVVSNDLQLRYCKGWRVLDVVVSGFFDSVGLYDDSGASEQQAARDWLAALNLLPLAGELYHELSFGEQRVVLLARAMVKQPAILILDEPCVGLDDAWRQLVLDVVDHIAATTPTQILFVSHDPADAPRCINQWLDFCATGVSIRE